jgi:hypothetical protein
MPSSSAWFPRARIRYQPLDSTSEEIEMAEHPSIPTTAYDDGREIVKDDQSSAHDIAGGNMDVLAQRDQQQLPGYAKPGDSSSTLGEPPSNDPANDGVSEEDLATLQRVSDKIPVSAWFIVVVELCERFTYYGLTPPFQNYIQGTPSSDPPGALGLGQQGATGLSNFFQFWVTLFCESS